MQRLGQLFLNPGAPEATAHSIITITPMTSVTEKSTPQQLECHQQRLSQSDTQLCLKLRCLGVFRLPAALNTLQLTLLHAIAPTKWSRIFFQTSAFSANQTIPYFYEIRAVSRLFTKQKAAGVLHGLLNWATQATQQVHLQTPFL
jgi:hypothetical protein